MLWVPPTGLRRLLTNYGTPSTTPGGSISDPASANTKSSYTSLGTLPADAHLLRLGFYDYHTTAANNCSLVDIAIDPAGGTSYTVLVANLIAGYTNVIDIGSRLYEIPIFVPAGSQIAWRMQGARTNDVVRLMFDAYGALDRPSWCATVCDSYGPDTSDSGAVAVNIGNSGAAGTWTQITSATVRDHFALITAISPPGSNAVLSNLGYNFDLGTGAASSEVEQIADCQVGNQSTSEDLACFPGGVPQFLDVPSGTRLAMRGSCSGTSQGMDAAIYGLS